VPEDPGFNGNHIQAFAANQGYRSSFKSSGSRHNRSRSASVKNLALGPISVPGQEQPEAQLITEEEQDAYMAKASGMGQTKGMSIISSEGEEEIKQENSERDPRLIHHQQQPQPSPQD